MACPFFVPIGLLPQKDWEHAPRLPLGDACRGVCQARPGETIDPPEEAQRELCNSGYAGGKCDRFPEGGPDAVRFSMVGGELVYIFEKDYAPVEHGTFGEHCSELLKAQAAAFMTARTAGQ